MNSLDRIISYFAPERGLARVKARATTNVIERKYLASSKSQQLSGWNPLLKHPDDEATEAGQTLIARALDAYHNTPYVTKALSVITNNVVGQGIKLKVNCESDKEEKRAQEIMDEYFERCDAQKHSNFYMQQAQFMNAVALYGSVICQIDRLKADEDKLLPMRTRLIDVVHLDSTREQLLSGKPIIKGGIEFGPRGETKALWLTDDYPDRVISKSPTSKRYATGDIWLAFKKVLPSQNLGVTWLHPVLIAINNLADFENATLNRQKISHSFIGIIEDIPNIETELPDEKEEGDEIIDIKPNRVYKMPPGKQFKFADPPTPHDYGTYTRAILKSISAGLHLSYEAMTTDLSEVNFSSMRAGWLEFHRNVQEWQQNLVIRQFCDPVFREAKKLLKANGVITSEMKGIWIPPRREMIDVVSEMDSLVQSLGAGLKSWTQAVIEMGYDPQALAAQLQKDVETFQKAGIHPSWMQEILNKGVEKNGASGAGRSYHNKKGNDKAASDKILPS